jgi:S1-C subfamily serine protease
MCAWVVALVGGQAFADPLGDAIATLREQYCDALRVARIALESEDGRRVELSFTAVTVAPDGLLMVPVPSALLDYPRGYIKHCELSRPGRPDDARPARLVGVNELFDLAFVAPAAAATSQPFVDFAAADPPPPVGQPVICLGLLDASLAFRCTFELARVGPAIGGDDFTVSGVPTDATGTLLLTPSGRLVGVARPPAFGDEEFLAKGGDDRSAGFIAQPQAVRASSLHRAVAFAVRERRDWPDPWVGVAGLQVADRDICEAYGLPADEVALIVGAVVEGYPAAEAGIRAKDFIIRFEGEPIPRGATDDETIAGWTRRIKHLAVGDSVRLTTWRDGKKRELTVRLAEAPVSETRAERDFNATLGLSVRDIVFSDRFARRLDRSQGGVVVARLVQSGPAETAELEEGDIIQKIDEAAIADIEAYRRVVAEKLAVRPAALVFSIRRGTSQQMIVRVDLQPPSGRTEAP